MKPTKNEIDEAYRVLASPYRMNRDAYIAAKSVDDDTAEMILSALLAKQIDVDEAERQWWGIVSAHDAD